MTAAETQTALPAELDEFIAGLVSVSWFAAVGDPSLPAENEAAAGYLAGLGRARTEISWTPDWRTAEALTQDKDWSRPWWRAEENARQDLLAAVRATHGDIVPTTALNTVMRAASDAVMGPAALAAGRAGIADQALVRVAAGAATQGCYQAALARLAGAGRDHAFALKFALFESGRWPLGVVSNALHVF